MEISKAIFQKKYSKAYFFKHLPKPGIAGAAITETPAAQP